MRSCAHKVPQVYILSVKNVERVPVNILTIISKPHAHPHNMQKTHAKFPNDRYKAVRTVALTKGTHCLYIEGEKLLSLQY